MFGTTFYDCNKKLKKYFFETADPKTQTVKKMSIVIAALGTAITTAVAGVMWYNQTTESSDPANLNISPDPIADTANPNSVQLSNIRDILIYANATGGNEKSKEVDTTKSDHKTLELANVHNRPSRSVRPGQANIFVASLRDILTAKHSLRSVKSSEKDCSKRNYESDVDEFEDHNSSRLDYSNHTLPLTGHAAFCQELHKTLLKRRLLY